jgi:hypothetical protein
MGRMWWKLPLSRCGVAMLVAYEGDANGMMVEMVFSAWAYTGYEEKMTVEEQVSESRLVVIPG